MLTEDLGAYPSEQGVAGLLASRAEEAYVELVNKDPAREAILRGFFLRAISLDDGLVAGRSVAWRELWLADAAERECFDLHVLPTLIERRLVVAHSTHVELAGEGLLTAWPRLGEWAESHRDDPSAPRALWRRTLEWEASGFAEGKLWTGDPVVGELFDAPGQNELERKFVVASEMRRRLVIALNLASRSKPESHVQWQRSAVLSARAAEIALATARDAARLLKGGPNPDDRALTAAWAQVRSARDLSRWASIQALHDVLAGTSLSAPLRVPPASMAREDTRVCPSGLGFKGEKEAEQCCLRLDRFAADSEEVLESVVYTWNLSDLSRPPRRLEGLDPLSDGQGGAGGKRPPFSPIDQFPIVLSPGLPPHARARVSHDRAVRYRPAPPPPPLPRRPAQRREQALLVGHEGLPGFLAFSKSGAWLASASTSPALPSPAPELRLWPLHQPSGPPSQPRTMPGAKLADLDAGDIFGASGQAMEIRISGSNFPIEVEVASMQWRLESIAADGSAFTLYHLNSGQNWRVDLNQVLDVPDEGGFFDTVTQVLGLLPAPRRAALPRLPIPPPPPGFPKPPFLKAMGLIKEFLFSLDGRWLGALSERGGAWLWSLNDLELVWSGENVSAMALSEDGRRLAVGQLDGAVKLWTAGEAAPAMVASRPVVLRSRRDEGSSVLRLVFSAGGEELAVERWAGESWAADKPRQSRVDIYRLRLEELLTLALGHAGRRLEERDLPPGLPADLVGLGTDEEERERVEADREAYFKLLGLNRK